MVKEPDMSKADEVDFTLRLWPLLKGDIVLPISTPVFGRTKSVDCAALTRSALMAL